MSTASLDGKTSLTWDDLAYSIKSKSGPDGRRMILHPQSGHAEPGDLLAIMGPSGSGKTSLLNALAGRLPNGSGGSNTGAVSVCGVPKQEMPCPFADISAYVEQDDALFALSTVQETLNFCALLRLPSKTTVAERENRIEGVLRQLGLLHVRQTNVGGSSFNGVLRGLSGGERKRLSIGMELLHKPSCIFLDEPTTGLDSYQALNVISKMKELASDGHTIIISIHQPRSAIFAMFTGVYLLAGGKPVYTGNADAASDYFGTLGYPLPPKFSPADFIIDLVSIDQRDKEQEESTKARLATLQESWASYDKKETGASIKQISIADSKQAILTARPEKPAGQTLLMKPFVLLLVRNWREQMRDMFTIIFKILFGAMISVVFGLVYWQLDRGQTSIQDRTGLLFFLTMNQAFGSTIGTSQVIPRQITVVQRERANRMYSILPYYISNLAVTLPIEAVPVLVQSTVVYFMADLSGSFLVFNAVIMLETLAGISLGMVLSACFKSVTMAPQLAPAVIILFLVFNGFMINEESIPDYFIWLREISFIRYAFKGVLVNEFKGASFTCHDAVPDMGCVTDGDAILVQLGATGDNVVEECCIILTAIAVVFNVLAYIILTIRRPFFLGIQSPAADAAAKEPQKSIPCMPSEPDSATANAAKVSEEVADSKPSEKGSQDYFSV